MFWLLSGIYFYTERYSLTALLVSRKMFSPYSMWHCNATRQKQGKRERMSMCASVCVGFFFFKIQQMFALLYILRRSDKRCKERSCWRKNKRFVERVFRHAQWSFKVYPLSQYCFYSLYCINGSLCISQALTSLLVSSTTHRFDLFFHRFKFDWTIKSQWYSVIVYNWRYYYKSISH